MSAIFSRRDNTPFWIYRDLVLSPIQENMLVSSRYQWWRVKNELQHKSTIIFPVALQLDTVRQYTAVVHSNTDENSLPLLHDIDMSIVCYWSEKGMVAQLPNDTTFLDIAPPDVYHELGQAALTDCLFRPRASGPKNPQKQSIAQRSLSL